MIKKITIPVIFSLLLVFVCGCSNQSQANTSEPQVNTSMMQINDDGATTELEPLPKVEGQWSAEELVLKQEDVSSLLEEWDYIERAVIVLSYPPENTETLCFVAALQGEDLEEHVDEISGMIKAELDSCDLAHSSIVDIVSGVVYPVR